MICDSDGDDCDDGESDAQEIVGSQLADHGAWGSSST